MKSLLVSIVAAVLLCTQVLADDSEPTKADATASPKQGQGLHQASTMGGGVATFPDGEKLHVFLLAGQSNMTGSGQGSELKPPHNQPHKRVRIWANNRWEFFVPQRRFGPGLALAHRLAKRWPKDNIGIIKVAIGGTGILSFVPGWSFEQANRTGDGKKGDLYRDMIDTVTAARKVGDFELTGFIWKQGGKDSRWIDLSNEYADNFKRMIAGLRRDLNVPKMPVFIANAFSSQQIKQDKALYEEKLKKKRRPGLLTVFEAQNRMPEELAHTVTLHHGQLPTRPDGIHYNTEGQLKLGNMIADAIENYYAR